ncbi:MAG: STAS domain-containing protein [Gemmataceae bacterium]
MPIQFTSGCLVASIQVELNDEVLERFQFDLLEQIRGVNPHGVILDVTAVEVMDSYDFLALRKTLSMAELMGPKTMLVGLRPGVVSALMDLDVDCEGVRGALTLEEALSTLRPIGAELENPSTLTKPDLPTN